MKNYSIRTYLTRSSIFWDVAWQYADQLNQQVMCNGISDDLREVEKVFDQADAETKERFKLRISEYEFNDDDE